MFNVSSVFEVNEKKGEDKADRKRGGKTASENGQAWSSPSPRGQWKTEKGIDDDDDLFVC